MVFPSSIWKDVRFALSMKHPLPMRVKLFGIVNVSKPHPANAVIPKLVGGVKNVTVLSDLHPEKHEFGTDVRPSGKMKEDKLWQNAKLELWRVNFFA